MKKIMIFVLGLGLLFGGVSCVRAEEETAESVAQEETQTVLILSV